MNILEQTDAKMSSSCVVCTSRRLCRNVARHFMDITKPLTFESTWPSLAKQGWHICKSSALLGSASKVAPTKYFWIIGAMTYALLPVNLTFNYGTCPVCKISHISKTCTAHCPSSTWQGNKKLKGLLSIDLRSYSVASPHIDFLILPSMHNMPTCFQ